MFTQFVTEGTTKLEVPELNRFRTKAGDYAPSLTSVFYNPQMELCRDISVSVAQVIVEELGDLYACDPLAGVGARGLRYAKEIKGITKAVVNDRSREAFELIERNAELNGLASLVEVNNEDANVLLWKNRGRFNFVDIDPFGSPAPFVDAACISLARKGMLAITATDTAPLCGSHSKACLRRYGAQPLRTEYCHELGVRILVGFCQRVAGKHDISLTPVLAHSTRHYLRIYLRAQRGARAADDILAQHGYVSHCRACKRRVLTRGIASDLPQKCECGSSFEHAGPLWLGGLQEKAFIARVLADLTRRDFKLSQSELLLLNRCMGEANGPPTFYNIHELAKLAGVSPPKFAELVSKLHGLGYFVSRTHFSVLGIRTDAPLEELLQVFKLA